MAKKLPPHLSEEILAKYTPNYDNNTLKVKAKILNLRKINKKETEIGDIHEVDFMPQVKIKRWYNDTNLSIRISEVADPSTPEVLTSGDKVLYKKDTFEARFYLLPDCDLCGGAPRASEFDVVLYTKPSTNKIDFTITSKNLIFAKQLPLTPEEIYEGVTRSQEVVNSYAVFHASKRGGVYGTGKAFHIYRPIIYDANDNYVYGDIHIYPARDGGIGTMTIEIPQEFLDNAVYPLIVDPTLGYTTLGGSSTGDKDTINGNEYTSPDIGSLTSMSVGVSSGSGTGRSIKAAMWLASTDARIDYTNTIANSSNGWNTVAFANLPKDIIATTYKLGWKSNVTQTKFAFDTATTLPTFYEDQAFANTMPDPLSPTTATNRQWSIYATYAKTFTFNGDAALARRITRSFEGDCILVKTVVDTFTGDANLERTISESFTSDANILNTLTTIFLGRASLMKEVEETFSGDASLAYTYEDTYTGDANLKKIVLQGFFSDANLLRVLPYTYTGDAILVKTEMETFTGDANLLKVDVGTFTGDANLYGQAVNVFTGDSSLQRELVSTFTGDANLGSRYTNTFTGDSSLIDTIAGTYTGDAYLEVTISNTFTSDCNLIKNVIATYTGDAHILSLSEDDFTGDANLVRENIEETFTGDAHFAETLSDTFTGDASLARVVPGTFTGDSHLAEIVTGTFTGDSSLIRTEENSFTGDASLGEISTYTFTGDAKLSGVTAGIFTGDANLYKDVTQAIVTTPWTAATQTGSFNEWTTPENALVDDANYAAALQAGAGSKWQSYHHFGFDIPVGATVLGVQVRYRHRESSTNPIDGGLDLRVTKPDTTYGEKASALYASTTTSILGTQNDTWGLSLTPAEVNSDDFMAEIGIYSLPTRNISSFLEYIEARIIYRAQASFSGDTNLLGTVEETFTGNSNLGGSGAGQFFGDASLLAILSGQFTGDASVKRIGAGIWTGNANLETTVIEMFVGEARLLGEGEAQFTGDAYLYDSDMRFLYGPWSYGAMFGGIISGAGYYLDTFTGDANLFKSQEQQFLGDASLIKELTDSYTGDANLEKYIEVTYTGDAHFAEIITGSFTGDAKLLIVISNQFTGDAYIDYPRFTGDANFGKLVTATFLGDAALFQEHIGTFNGDASLLAVEATTFTGDANLYGEVVTAFTGDASLQSEEAGVFTGDATIKTLHTATYTGDTNLLKAVEESFTGDASFISIVESQFTGSASLIKVDIITTFTGDASILIIEPGTFRGDAYFTVEAIETFAGVVVLESLDQFAGFAGTCDCISAAGAPGWGISGMEEFGISLGI